MSLRLKFPLISRATNVYKVLAELIVTESNHSHTKFPPYTDNCRELAPKNVNQRYSAFFGLTVLQFLLEWGAMAYA